jgi:hypothetical protein
MPLKSRPKTRAIVRGFWGSTWRSSPRGQRVALFGNSDPHQPSNRPWVGYARSRRCAPDPPRAGLASRNRARCEVGHPGREADIQSDLPSPKAKAKSRSGPRTHPLDPRTTFLVRRPDASTGCTPQLRQERPAPREIRPDVVAALLWTSRLTQLGRVAMKPPLY